jgi:hypothetical protein
MPYGGVGWHVVGNRAGRIHPRMKAIVNLALVGLVALIALGILFYLMLNR